MPPDDAVGRGESVVSVGGETFTEEDLVEVWRSLSAGQRAALCVLADGREHYCWKRASDATVRAGRGAVNARATGSLRSLKLARTTSYGDGFTGDHVEITDLGQAVWDASVLDG